MSIKSVQVASLGELIDCVTPDKPDPRTGRRRDAGVYRGANDADAPLFTSLDRLGDGKPHAKAELEGHILRNFIRYSRPHLGREPANDWEHLVSAQHHGAPTRLLDWTYSPLVAAFFATRPLPGPDRDRVVWRLDWQPIHEKFGLPPRSLMPGDLGELFEKGAHFTPWDLFEAKESHAFAALVEPPSLDGRLVTQSAVFTLSSDKTMSLDDFLARHGLAKHLTRFILPARQVARLRDQLDLVGMDERRLFPDLDGVAASLRRYYG